METMIKRYLKEHLHPHPASIYQWNHLVEHVMGVFKITKRVATKAIDDAGYEKKRVYLDKRRRPTLIFFRGKRMVDTGFDASPTAVLGVMQPAFKHLVPAIGIPTTATSLHVRRVLGQQMKVSRSDNVTNGIKWFDLVDCIKGHFNVTARRANYFIIRAGYLPRRFEAAGAKHINGVISAVTGKFMIKK